MPEIRNLKVDEAMGPADERSGSVIGATGGIGRAVAEALAGRGWKVPPIPRSDPAGGCIW
jgi:hypothetical protein